MGTVRYTSTTPPPPPVSSVTSSGKKGGKRKAVSASKARTVAVRALNPHLADPDDLSVAHALAQEMLDQRLASRDKWQVATQRNLSSIRTECMAVRREIGRVEETIETVQMQVEDGLAGYTRRREELQKFMEEQHQRVTVFCESMEASEKRTLEHKDTTQRQLLKLKKKLDESLEKQPNFDVLVDEDTLMTQLAGLQERYDNDLAAAKSEIDSLVDAKVRAALEDVNRKMIEMQESFRRKERDEREMDQRSQSTSSHVQEQMGALQRRIAELEHHSIRLSADNEELRAALDSSMKESVDTRERMAHMSRDLDHHDHVLRNLPRHHSPQLAPHPPPQQAPSVNLAPLEEKLHYVSHDVRIVRDEMIRWKDDLSVLQGQLRQEMNARMSDMEDRLFKALDHDSGMHQFENTRLKDVCFDLRTDVSGLRMQLIGIHEQVMKEVHATVAQSNRSPVHGRGSRYAESPRMDGEEAYYRALYREPVRPRSRSRSRSRSRGRRNSRPRSRSHSRSRSPRYRRDSIPLTTSEMLYRPLNRPSEPSPSERATSNAPSNSTRLTPRTLHQSRRPQRSHEVIVIEIDGDDDEEMKSSHEGPVGGAAPQEPLIPPQSMAPPEVVMDDEVLKSLVRETIQPDAPASDAVVDSSSVSQSSRVLSATEHDLRTGAKLYLCYGGAPTLGLDWAPLFSAMRTSDMVDAADMLSFQSRYSYLSQYPPAFAQLVVRAAKARVEIPDGGKDTVDDTFTMDASAVAKEFAQTLSVIRTMWGNCTVEILSEDLKHIPGNGPTKSSLSKPPPQLADVREHRTALQRWALEQSKAMAQLLSHQRQRKGFMPEPRPFAPASASVFLFLCMFDITELDCARPTTARFRLNTFGKQLLAKLWDHLLNMIDTMFFVECSWLDDQSSQPIKVPILAVAHLLSTILPWISAEMQLDPEGFQDVVTRSVTMLKELLIVDGKPIAEIEGDGSIDKLLPMDDSRTIDLQLSSNQWPMVVDLDGFWDVVADLAAP